MSSSQRVKAVRNTADITFAGMRAVLDAEGAVYLPEREMVIAAEVRADSAEALSRLSSLLHAYAPRVFVSLGEPCREAAAAGRIAPDIVEKANAVCASVPRFVWVTGAGRNDIPEVIHGERYPWMTACGLLLTHACNPRDPLPQIAGCYRPEIRLHKEGKTLSGACFLRGERRLALPAFSGYTGTGRPHNAPDIRDAMGDAYAPYLLHSGKIFALPAREAVAG